jgi:hypothetical protein
MGSVRESRVRLRDLRVCASACTRVERWGQPTFALEEKLPWQFFSVVASVQLERVFALGRPW